MAPYQLMWVFPPFRPVNLTIFAEPGLWRHNTTGERCSVTILNCSTTWHKIWNTNTKPLLMIFQNHAINSNSMPNARGEMSRTIRPKGPLKLLQDFNQNANSMEISFHRLSEFEFDGNLDIALSSFLWQSDHYKISSPCEERAGRDTVGTGYKISNNTR